MTAEQVWTGKPISKPGIYRGIGLSEYHEKADLFDGPSISKSSLKHLLPSHGGSPKAFWGRWRHNPEHIAQKSTDALNFGKAAHCLLLGDEVFDDSFVIRPDEYPDAKTGEMKPWNGNAGWCKGWLADHAGKTIVTADQMTMIRKMRDDAARYPLVQQGLLNGAVERTMACKDSETGIWLKVRPDVIPAADGVYADLKTTADLSEDFLERQAFDACYYLQGAMIRMVCRELKLPFTTFALLYVLKDEIPDTAHVELSEHELDRGEREIRWALTTIRKCLDAGEWPGARPFKGGEQHLQLKNWHKTKIDDFLEMEQAA
jgi:hypothetical protein